MITPHRVREAVDQLASDTWARREDEAAIKRLHEIRALAEEQLRDDVMSTAGRGRSKVGRQWVMTTDRWNERYQPITPAYTPDQLEFQTGIEPFLGELTGEDRLLIRWTYDQMLDIRSIARLLHVTHPTVLRRLEKLHQKLRERLTQHYSKGDEDGSNPSGTPAEGA